MTKSEKIIKSSLEFAKVNNKIVWYQKIDQAIFGGQNAGGFNRGSAPLDFILIDGKGKLCAIEVKECQGLNFNIKSRISELQKELLTKCDKVYLIVMFYNNKSISTNSKDYFEYWRMWDTKNFSGALNLGYKSLNPFDNNAINIAQIQDGIKENIGIEYGLSSGAGNKEKGINLF